MQQIGAFRLDDVYLLPLTDVEIEPIPTSDAASFDPDTGLLRVDGNDLATVSVADLGTETGRVIIKLRTAISPARSSISPRIALIAVRHGICSPSPRLRRATSLSRTCRTRDVTMPARARRAIDFNDITAHQIQTAQSPDQGLCFARRQAADFRCSGARRIYRIEAVHVK